MNSASGWKSIRPPSRPKMITTGSDNQPYAYFSESKGVVELVIPGMPSAPFENVIRLSAAKAEEIAIELEHAAKMMRGEA